MAVNTVNNRQILSSFRSTLNTWAAAINTLITNVADNTADIVDINADINDLSAALDLKQGINQKSTLTMSYRTATGADALMDSDGNGVIEITNSGSSNFNIPVTGTIPSVIIGNVFIVSNNPTSSGAITITLSGGVTLTGSTNIAVGTSAYIIKTGTNSFKRLF